jgi:DSF synthase
VTVLRTLPVDREPSWQSGLTGEATFPCQRRRLDGYHRQLEMQFDPELGALWTLMRPEGVPCFNLDLLAELIDGSRLIEANDGKVDVDGAPVRARYWVVASRAPGVFNYGGDLALFARLAQARDRRGLLHYATLCVDNLHRRITGFHPPMITLALVQGEALGGGFEAVLSNQVIIAERSSTFGFPEILFNLFPGMGAYSFLARLIGARRAEEIITSGALYGAAELAELGIVDVVAEDGQGEAVATGFMKDRLRRHNSYSALLQARRELFPIHRDELMRIATIWVDAALRLESKDLRIMQRLVSAQEKRFAGRDGAIADGEVGDFRG